MKNIILVVKHDIRITLMQRTFWIFTVIIAAMMVGIGVMNASDPSASEQNSELVTQDGQSTGIPHPEIPLIGLVDLARLIGQIPPGIPPEMFVPFNDLDIALAMLKQGELRQVAYIPPEHLSSGELLVYDQNYQLRMNGEDMGVAFGSQYDWVLPYLINYNLSGDAQLVAALRNLLEFQPPGDRQDCQSGLQGTSEDRGIANYPVVDHGYFSQVRERH
jgi:hypothetical protein